MAWFQKVSDAVYKAACAAFHLDPESAAGLARFVPAYLPNSTTPQALRDSNVCYYSVSERQGTNWDYYMAENVKNGILVKKTIPVTVLFTFYGPNADDDAEYFWSSLQVDTGYGCPKYSLRADRIVLDGTPSRPISIFEVEGTYHRRRADVRVDLAYYDIPDTPETAPSIEHIPEINSIVESQNGEITI